MICVRHFFADRDGTHAVMREEPYSLFTPCRAYEVLNMDIQYSDRFVNELL